MRHRESNVLKYQTYCEGVTILPRNTGECGKEHIPSDLVVKPYVLHDSLEMVWYYPHLGSLTHRPSDLRVTHAKHSPPDPRKPDHHHRFSQQSDLLSAPWRRQGVCRIGHGVHPFHRFSAQTQGDL